MADAARGGMIMTLFEEGGIGNISPSIARCPVGIDIRLMSLVHIGINFDLVYYGDELTWDLAETLFKFGDSTAIKYSALQTGWQYNYDAYGQVFHVIDNVGNETVFSAKTLSELGIVWEILVSHQFMIYFSAAKERPAEYVAVKHTKFTYNSDSDNDAAVMNLYRLIGVIGDDGKYKPIYNLLSDVNRAEMPELNNELVQILNPAIDQADILISAPLRETTGDYSGFMQKVDADYRELKRNKKRNAVVDMAIGEFLMIAAFATLGNRGNPIYEPWMLWEMWKWVVKGTTIAYTDKIFDMSPNWG